MRLYPASTLRYIGLQLSRGQGRDMSGMALCPWRPCQDADLYGIRVADWTSGEMRVNAAKSSAAGSSIAGGGWSAACARSPKPAFHWEEMDPNLFVAANCFLDQVWISNHVAKSRTLPNELRSVLHRAYAHHTLHTGPSGSRRAGCIWLPVGTNPHLLGSVNGPSQTQSRPCGVMFTGSHV